MFSDEIIRKWLQKAVQNHHDAFGMADLSAGILCACIAIAMAAFNIMISMRDR